MTLPGCPVPIHEHDLDGYDPREDFAVPHTVARRVTQRCDTDDGDVPDLDTWAGFAFDDPDSE